MLCMQVARIKICLKKTGCPKPGHDGQTGDGNENRIDKML